jgi:hypothetical protein
MIRLGVVHAPIWERPPNITMDVRLGSEGRVFWLAERLVM